MTRRGAIILWTCAIAIQVTGLTLDFMGGSLDDPVRLVGLLVLEPGLSVVWGQAQSITTPRGYYSLLGTAVGINLVLAGIIHLLWVLWAKSRRA